MKVRVHWTDENYLEVFLNRIGYERVLQIIPCHRYDGCLLLVIYKESSDEV